MTSLLSDQNFMDMFVEKESSSLLNDDMDIFDSSLSCLAEFESLLESNDDIYNLILDGEAEKMKSSPSGSIEGSTLSNFTSDYGSATTDNDDLFDRLMGIESHSSSSERNSYSDDENSLGSAPHSSDELALEFQVASPEKYITQVETVDVTQTTDMTICADVEVATTDEIVDPNVTYEFILSDPETIDITTDNTNDTSQLHLTDEENKLLRREGIVLPTNLPLTKAEERQLKRIRRKIRNKESAQNSRKKKKEYVDGLENRVKLCTSQNMDLKKKIVNLEIQNKALVTQLRKLQTYVNANNTRTTQTTLYAVILLLSFAVLLFPNSKSGTEVSKQQFPSTTSRTPFPGNSRSLLSHSPKSLFNGYGEELVEEDDQSAGNELFVEADNESSLIKSEWMETEEISFIDNHVFVEQPQQMETSHVKVEGGGVDSNFSGTRAPTIVVVKNNTL